MGRKRTKKVLKGETVVIELPVELLEKMEDTVDMMDGIVSHSTAARQLGVTEKTLTNYVCEGSVPKDLFFESPVTKKRSYLIYPLIGWIEKRFPWKRTQKWKRSA